MLKKPCEFVNRAEDRIELLCLTNNQNIVQKIIDAKGRLYSPVFLRGHYYFYVWYQKDQWFLLK